MTVKHTFKNTGEKEINDVRLDNIFPVEGHSYTILIKPKTSFWRVGLRYYVDRRGMGWSTTSRYSNSQIQHLEVCVGKRDVQWSQPNSIELLQYHVSNTDKILLTSEHYQELSDVILIVQSKPAGIVDVTLKFSGSYSHSIKINLGFAKAFQVFAWADSLDFELDCEVEPELIPYRIELRELKALLTQGKTSININKLAVFFGGNNCGKTSILVGACNSHPIDFTFSVDYLGLNRFQGSSNYNYEYETLTEREKLHMQDNGRRRRKEPTVGQHELFDWMEEISLQEESIRLKILEWVKSNFEEWTFNEIKKGQYTTGVEAKINGANPLEQGTGAKAALPIIIQLFNPHIEVLAIDEPELGLEPRMQKIVFNCIKAATEGKNGFPLKRILLATHSHLFLDRENIENNFMVTKEDGVVKVRQVKSVDELQGATFRLLGSNPSDLFFPSNIIIVEGESDQIFLNSIYKIGREKGFFESENMTFHFIEGFDKLSYASEAIVQMFKTQAYSPVYKDKICGLFDKPFNNKKRIESIRSYFNDNESKRFILLPEPAIEYYYPPEIINKVFSTSFSGEGLHSEIKKFLESMSDHFPFVGDFLDQKLTKKELAKMVASQMTSATLDEINPVIIDLLKKADELAYR